MPDENMRNADGSIRVALDLTDNELDRLMRALSYREDLTDLRAKFNWFREAAGQPPIIEPLEHGDTWQKLGDVLPTYIVDLPTDTVARHNANMKLREERNKHIDAGINAVLAAAGVDTPREEDEDGEITITVDQPELDTILAALRLWQATNGGITTVGAEQLAFIHEIMPQRYEDRLDDGALDELCERINI